MQIATCLERNTELELEMITVSDTLRIYNQNNLKATRKQVLPIISTILNGPGTQRNSASTDGRCDPCYAVPAQQPWSYHFTLLRFRLSKVILYWPNYFFLFIITITHLKLPTLLPCLIIVP